MPPTNKIVVLSGFTGRWYESAIVADNPSRFSVTEIPEENKVVLAATEIGGTAWFDIAASTVDWIVAVNGADITLSGELPLSEHEIAFHVADNSSITVESACIRVYSLYVDVCEDAHFICEDSRVLRANVLHVNATGNAVVSNCAARERIFVDITDTPSVTLSKLRPTTTIHILERHSSNT